MEIVCFDVLFLLFNQNFLAFDMMNQMCQPDLYGAASVQAAVAATHPWAYPYPQYQFGAAPYPSGIVDIPPFGKSRPCMTLV